MDHSRIHVPPSAYTVNKSLDDILYPEMPAYDKGYLKVSSLHNLYYSQHGNPNGVPVLVVHGGPGAGCNSFHVRVCDPTYYRIICLDQRGAVRSQPTGEIKENTTLDLIADMEILRKHLNIQQWILWGFSWGSALSLAYSQAHPNAVIGLVLRGIFLGRAEECLQLINSMKDHFPEAWHEFVDFLPKDERHDLLKGYYTRLIHTDSKVHMPAAKAFMKYDIICSTMLKRDDLVDQFLACPIHVLCVTRIFMHYAYHQCFFAPNQLLNNLHKIKHLPVTIVHGRYDVITRPHVAYELHKALLNSKLLFIQDAGHAGIEPGISTAVVETFNKFKEHGKF
jgi:proline iminopeptidase